MPPSRRELEEFGVPPEWSSVVEVPSHDGATYSWHVLQRPGTSENAPVVLCLHGNPTWSFLWSRLFHELKSNVRLIAPDHLAMGYSQNTGPRTYETRVKDIGDLLRALNISEPVWIVAQDWGGALAMGYAVAHPKSVAGLLLSNTGIAIPHGRRAPLLIKISAASGLHQFITQRTPLFVKGTPLLPGHSLSKVQRKALAAPYKNAHARQGVAGFVAEVPFNEQHHNHSVLDGIAEQLPQLNIPVRLIWGAKDPVFNDDFADDLLHRFRNVALHRIAQAGHLAVLETSIASFVEDAMQDTSVQKSLALSLGEPEPLWGRLEQADRAHELAVHDATAQESVTFGEFSARVATYAQELHRQGVQRGQRIAVLVPPSVDLIAVVYAAWRIGAITVIADRGLGLRGLGNAVRSARVQHVVGPQKALLAARALRCAPHSTFIALGELQGAKKLESLAELYAPPTTATRSCSRTVHVGSNWPRKRCALHAPTTVCTARCIARVVWHYTNRPLCRRVCAVRSLWASAWYLHWSCQYGCHSPTHTYCPSIKRSMRKHSGHHGVCFSSSTCQCAGHRTCGQHKCTEQGTTRDVCRSASAHRNTASNESCVPTGRTAHAIWHDRTSPACRYLIGST